MPTTTRHSAASKGSSPIALLVALYGAFAYLLSLVVIGGLFLFWTNWLSPYTVDGGEPAPLFEALAIDLLLIVLFGVQHTLMARPSFKRWWKRFVPESIERSTYLLWTVALFALLFVAFRPIAGVVWHVEAEWARGLLWGVYGLGWGVVLISTFLIDHFELMGLRQTIPFFGEAKEKLHTPLFYRFVRHPMMTGWLITFWATPTMSVGHLFLAAGFTVYILIALYFEERTLLARFGESYRRYRERVPKLVPTGKRLPPDGAP